MKRLVKTLIIASCALFVSFSFLTSCKHDKCKGMTCKNAGTCQNGSCTCAPGYTGNMCVTVLRDQFIGVHAQSGASGTFPVSVEKDTKVTDVRIMNFHNTFTQPINAYVSGLSELIIPAQNIDGKIIEGRCHGDLGTGGGGVKRHESTIFVHYTITDPATGTVSTVNTYW